MNKFIKDKSELNKRLIGGKAYNLGILEQAGLNVPEWFCISSECKKDNLLELREELEKYINENFNEQDIFSVRSSGIVEDGKNFSFAGQYDTFLNVNRKDLIDNIQKCWESADKENIKDYTNVMLFDEKLEHKKKRSSKNKPLYFSDSLKMGVIIQKMINPDCSGVLFTANPNGLLNEMVIVNGAGEGANVVEDKVPVCTYYYNKTDRIFYFEKQEEAEELNRDKLDEIFETGNKIYDIFKKHMDIEWCIKDNQLYILQARPITTIEEKEVVVLDNSNIVESYPNITLPLTQSFVREAYYRVFKGAFTRLVKNKKVIKNNDKYLREMLGVTNGRVYYNISNWYTFINVLPFNKKIIPVWQEMMGVSDKEITANKQKVGFLTHTLVALNSLYLLATVNHKMKKLNDFFLSIPEYFNKNFHPELNNKELLKLHDDLAEKLAKDWDITLGNDMSTFIFTGAVKSKFKKLGIEDYAIETNKYISGLAGINSMNPVKELVKISKIVANDEELLQELKELETDEDFYKYITNKSKNKENEKNEKDIIFIDFLNYYIKEFGDRSIEELKLESKTFRTSPIILVKKILQYAENKERLEALAKSFTEQEEKIDISEGILRNSSKLATEGKDKKNGVVKQSLLLKFYTKKATEGIKNREISRLNRSRIYGMIRKIFLKIGENLQGENKLEDKEDVFYLYYDEIQKTVDNATIDLKHIVQERKLQYEKYNDIPTYSRLVFSGQPFDKKLLHINMPDNNSEWDKLYGTPCSSGIIEGEVIVVEDPKSVTNIEGKILVTKMTDPGWVFLLTMAKGIISEKGSLLSHTAIISRELKVPSIVRCTKCY